MDEALLVIWLEGRVTSEHAQQPLCLSRTIVYDCIDKCRWDDL